VGPVPAAWVSFTGSFATTDIPDGAGQLTSSLTVSGLPNLPASGANIRIRLIGLVHSWSGDLEVTVRNVLSGITETVFSQICQPPETLGCASNFGSPDGSELVFSDYVFQAGGAYNLWTMAQPPFASDADMIQAHEDFLDADGNVVARLFAGSNNGSSADNNLFLSLNGLDPNGEWIITVRDLAAEETGTILGWGVDVWVNEVPEPATNGMIAAGLLAMFWHRFRR
jgi:hypothetical protein